MQTALAAQVKLAWDPSPDPEISGYKVHFGKVSCAQTESVDVGNVTQYVLMGLLDGTTYYFAATAYDRYGRESVFSNEVSTTTSSSSCTYTTSPASQSFTAAGGSGTAAVTASAGCAWTASSGAAWITVTSGASGTGSGAVGYTVASNTGAARSATMTIAGRILTVSQAAALPAASFTITASAGTGGTISPSGAVLVQAGSSRTLTIIPSSRYRISSVVVDGVSKGAVSAYTFSNVTAPHTITAIFRRRS